MASQCRACLSTLSKEFIHLESDFTEEQTYFDCFNECTHLQASWDDDFSQVICQECLVTLHTVYDFIRTAQKSDTILRKQLKPNFHEHKSEAFAETDIENMEIMVLESLGEQALNAKAIDEEYKRQRISQVENSAVTCQICSEIFKERIQLEEHLCDEHNEVESDAGFIALVTCENCNKICESNKILNWHKLIFHGKSPNEECAICCKSIKENLEDMSEHISMEHPVEYAKLFHSFSVAPTIDEDLIVEDFRTGEEVTGSEDNVNNLEVNNSTAYIKCTICNKEIPESNMNKHITKHTHENIEKQFLCSFCPRDFKTQKSLRQHEKIHFEATEDSVYVCTDCNRQYSTGTLLEQHRKNAHKLREYVCKICGNAFKLKNQLNNHMKLHLEKNISCPHCEKRYARRFDLNVHLRTHTGEMPYECHLCEKKFAIKVRLTYHLQKHYGIKHSCKECGAEFNSKPKLKAHSFKHTGMPYRCELCDNHGFPNRDVFKRHLLRVHNATITEEDLLDMFQRNTGKSTRIREVNDCIN